MALAVTVRIDFKDNKDQSSFTEVHVPVGFTLPQYVEFAQDLATLVNDLHQGTITGASITFSLDISGATIKTIANAFSDIAQRARVMFTSAASGFRKLFNIPSIDESIVTAGSDEIDTSDPIFTPFTTMIVNGQAVTGGTIQFTDSRQNDLVALSFAREGFDNTAT